MIELILLGVGVVVSTAATLIALRMYAEYRASRESDLMEMAARRMSDAEEAALARASEEAKTLFRREMK